MNITETQDEGVDTTVETADEGVETEIETQEDAGSDEASNEPLQIDYKSEYEKLQQKIAGDAFRFRKEKRVETKSDDSEPEGDDEDDDRPLTRKEMEKMLAEREQKILRQGSLKEATTLARSFVETDDEAKYAAALWEHVQLPFDSMEEQMRFIIGGMNSSRLLAQNSELKRTIQSKTLARKNTATTMKDATINTPKIKADVKSALERTGFKYDTTKKAWSKTLANGRKMFNDGNGKKWFE